MWSPTKLDFFYFYIIYYNFLKTQPNKYKRKEEKPLRKTTQEKPPKGGDMSGIVNMRTPNIRFCCSGKKYRFVLSLGGKKNFFRKRML